jgi:transposase-like protein
MFEQISTTIAMKTTALNNHVKTRALADYLDPDQKVVDIAKRHDIAVSKLSNWIREENVPRRHRGLRRLVEPSARAQQILAYAGTHGFSNAASYFNVSKQLVSSLAKRWNTRSPNCSKVSQPKAVTSTESKQKDRRPKREIVVTFRLRKDELSLVRALQPPGEFPPTTSDHKLVRAVVLARLENAQIWSASLHSSPPGPGSDQFAAE